MIETKQQMQMLLMIKRTEDISQVVMEKVNMVKIYLPEVCLSGKTRMEIVYIVMMYMEIVYT